MLYIMRHGKTLWNEQSRLQGRTDIPLNEEGRRMAECARDAAKSVHIDICFSSPLLRAYETAQIVLEGRNVPIFKDERLLEMSFGQYEGTHNYFSDPDHPLHALFQQPELYTKPVGDAESLQELYARTGAFLEDSVYPRLAKGEDILIVGHGAMNSALICQIRQLPVCAFWKSGIENCKLIRVI